jgi:CheY-like chemotaxis protein
MIDTLKVYVSAFAKMDSLRYLLDPEGHLLACNENLLRFLGYEHNEKSIYEMMLHQGHWTSQQIQHFHTLDLDTLVSGKKHIENQIIVTEIENTSHIKISRIPLLSTSGDALGLMVVWEDMTQQKQLDDQLKALKIQLRHAHKMLGLSHTVDDEANTMKKSVKVLLIEDNLITQKVEKSILACCRCITDVVSTPEQVNEIFRPGKYDLVLMDIGLEKGNGYQVTSVLRQKEAGTDFRVPIIALTGLAEAEVSMDCDDAEMDGILCKPLSSEQAKQLIQRYIDHANVMVKGLKEFKQ